VVPAAVLAASQNAMQLHVRIRRHMLPSQSQAVQEPVHKKNRYGGCLAENSSDQLPTASCLRHLLLIARCMNHNIIVASPTVVAPQPSNKLITSTHHTTRNCHPASWCMHRQTGIVNLWGFPHPHKMTDHTHPLQAVDSVRGLQHTPPPACSTARLQIC
jgi:hypothetical protein